MADPAALDTGWLKAHPLPAHADDIDKNDRGKLLVIGGSRRVPGGIGLTAEAAFRAGAGKVTIATIAAAAIPLGLAFPECAVLALGETAEGEIAANPPGALLAELASYDALIIGPAMTDDTAADALLAQLLPALPDRMFLLVDAAALRAAGNHRETLSQRGARTVFTPHQGELAAMLGIGKAAVDADPLAALETAAERFGGAVMVKGATSHIRAGDACLAYAGGGIGLATGGSGDVLAGLIGALGAQGLAPLQAAAWGTWLHGEAGRRLSETMGPIGFLARELPALVPGLMRGV
ncbi:hydroxyethylthiazole kinase-like uncharacterized protein yjeF [Sphingopyxis panaciterrae]|uniref:NAD(P)H-hydrate dehydratase n=1 Tax=Sphingopyxis panaciterrae TaxID=363841 RepID=UPI003132B244|nr:hydroxyethylthiazole kinase-like uncharacterized protein yjeF [Sphingopyxis panaciterrae]